MLPLPETDRIYVLSQILVCDTDSPKCSPMTHDPNCKGCVTPQGNYKEAGEYFNRAYNISRAMGENESIQVNRVQSGIAQAHAMLNMYSKLVVDGASSRDCLERAMDWKSIRANIYESREERRK